MNIPSAGKYDFKPLFAIDACKFSIVGKGKYPESPTKNYPGPGEYKQISINPEGKYFKSNFQNVANILFGISTSPRTVDYSLVITKKKMFQVQDIIRMSHLLQEIVPELTLIANTILHLQSLSVIEQELLQSNPKAV